MLNFILFGEVIDDWFKINHNFIKKNNKTGNHNVCLHGLDTISCIIVESERKCACKLKLLCTFCIL